MTGPTAAARWRAALDARTIPERIVKTAPESPWGFPPELFRSRALEATSREQQTPTTAHALESLPAAGSVLDVGVGGGATSLPLVGRAAVITGVDQQADMLRVFAEAAREAGVEPRPVRGRWPDVEGRTPSADVVVSGHTIYNAPDLALFVRALTVHARHRVVLEATDRHPLGWMGGLWRRFHGIEIPDEPTVDLAIEVLGECGVEPSRQDRPGGDEDPAGGGFQTRENAVAFMRKRLCLPLELDDELVEALGERLRVRNGLWSAGPVERTVVTLWWDTAGG